MCDGRSILKESQFTLIEFLIAISVLLLLLSFLSPAYQRTIKMSQNVHCKLNLQSFARVMQIYCEDNNNIFPGPHREPNLSPLTKGGVIQQKFVSYLESLPISWKTNSNYYRELLCPATKESEFIEVQPELRPSYRLKKGDDYFGTPSHLDRKTGIRTVSIPPKSFLEVESPFIEVMLTDNDQWIRKRNDISPYPVHEGLSRNMLFYDFHIEDSVIQEPK